jgi:hypothetical protein
MSGKPMFIFGNGLSMALSREFSLKTITEKFINELNDFDKEFMEDLCNRRHGSLNFDDFEVNFTAIESALLNLRRYRVFIDSDIGMKFLAQFKVRNPNLIDHEKIIERIYTKYINMILEIIHGNVRKEKIADNLGGFCDFLINEINNSEKSYIFTLNYDLLVETILLEFLGANQFTDFCHPANIDKYIGINKYNFNPSRCSFIYNEAQKKTELHHLHGSLSLFYNVENNQIFKFISSDIADQHVYKNIYEKPLPYVPAIITGGGKSDKINEYPFFYYYKSIKDICEFGYASKLYIVGYSFRDEHINELINTWMNNVKDYKESLLIVDFRQDDDSKEDFKEFVRSKIKKRPRIPDQCFEFGGANNIKKVLDTEAKKRNIDDSKTKEGNS